MLSLFLIYHQRSLTGKTGYAIIHRSQHLLPTCLYMRVDEFYIVLPPWLHVPGSLAGKRRQCVDEIRKRT